MGNINQLTEKCLICSGRLTGVPIESRDFLSKVKGHFYYKICDMCGSYMQFPLPEQDFLKKCYESQTLGYFQPPDRETLSNSYRVSEGSTLRRLIYTIFPRIKTIRLLPDQPAPARVLEIGCSYGARLYNLNQMGYSVIGVELNDKMVLFARERLGLDVRKGLIEDISFEDDSFDVIIMSMVLEHFLSPVGIISRVIPWLKPGGELLLSIPCCDGFEFKIFKEYCYVIHPPYHIFIPSLLGISVLLKPHFKIEKIAFQFFHRDLTASASFAYAGTLKPFYRMITVPGKSVLMQKIIRLTLFVLTSVGLKTSRVSIRCVKK